MQISPILTAEHRAEALVLFRSELRDVEANAIPAPEHSSLYLPVLLEARTDDGVLMGAALSCQTTLAVGAAQADPKHPRVSRIRARSPHHSMLDMLAVEPRARRQGVGTALLKRMTTDLRMRGTEFWFGCVTTDLDTDALRRFYQRAGFTVLEPGDPLPMDRGISWAQGVDTADLAFWFYRKFKPAKRGR